MWLKIIKSHLVLFLLCFCGCVSHHATYYKDKTDGVDVKTHPNVDRSNSLPRLITTFNPKESVRKLREEGYRIIGHSCFLSSKDFSESEAIEFAKQNNASLILYYKKYQNSQSSSIPLVLPNTQTSYNSIIGTTTTYGTDTTYIPTTQHYFEYQISYWVKLLKFRLGVQSIELDDSDKLIVGSNKGVKVDIVVKNSPAYESDILPGDFIRKISDDSVIDVKSFNDLVEKNEGKTVKITLLRSSHEMTKEVRINKIPK